MTATSVRAAKRQRDATGGLMERLNDAMLAWAMRHKKPAADVEAALDRLHAAWASLSLDDVPTSTRRRTADPKRTVPARRVKAIDDADRERFVVRRYAQVIRQTKNAKLAREIVAAEVRACKHNEIPAADLAAMPRWMREGMIRPSAYTRTYSEKSVARVLKRYAAK